MSTKFKVLGLGLLATLAMSAFAVMNASATSTGHFISAVDNTTLVGSENATHFTELTSHGIEGGIVCDKVSYHASVVGKTNPDVTVTPSYDNCHTTGGSAGEVTVHENGCTYTFTSGHVGTVHLVCPAGKGIEITHTSPSCTIRITPQTVSGVTYTNKEEGGINYITLDVNSVQFNTEYEAGICIFTGTNHVGTLHGSVTVKGFDANNPTTPVNISHNPTP